MSEPGEAKTPSDAPAEEAPSNPGRYDQVAVAVYGEAENSIVSAIAGDFTAADGIRLANHLMEFIRKFPEIPGEDKKAIVMKVVNRILDAVPMSGEVREGVRLALFGSGVLEAVIIAIARAWKKHFDVDGDGTITAEEYRQMCCPCIPAGRAK